MGPLPGLISLRGIDMHNPKRKPDVLIFSAEVVDGLIKGASMASLKARYACKEVVLADTKLDLGAKLIYSEIIDLCKKKGFCYISDAVMAIRCGCSESAVSRAVKRLKKRGYVRCDLHRVGRKYKRNIFIPDVRGRDLGQA